jgi:hypothetical protein
MTTTVSPWPLVRRGDRDHPVQILQHLLRAPRPQPTVDH